MKTFREFITEVEEISDIGKKGRSGMAPRYNTESELIRNGAKHISTTPSGHRIYKGKLYDKTNEYSVIHPKSGKVEMSVKGDEHKGVLSNLCLAANKGNTIKAHDFYHHLITQHNKTLVADAQSEGGHNVWKNLQKKHGKSVNIHGWSKGKSVNIHMGDDEYTHGTYPDWYKKSSPEENDALNMKLVAHKK